MWLSASNSCWLDLLTVMDCNPELWANSTFPHLSFSGQDIILLKQQDEKLDLQLRQGVKGEEVKASTNAHRSLEETLKPRLNEWVVINQRKSGGRRHMKNDILRPLKSHHLFIQGIDEHQSWELNVSFLISSSFHHLEYYLSHLTSRQFQGIL